MEATTRNQKHKWYVQAREIVREYAETLFVLLFIINGLATFLILFDKIEIGSDLRHIVGALAFGFAMVMFIKFTNRGVKRNQ